MKTLARLLPRALRAPAPPPEPLFVPNGHFYSPVVDRKEARAQQDRLWPPHPLVRGIDFNDASHQRILTEVFPRYMPDYDYPGDLEVTDHLDRFFSNNPQFGWLDARALFVMLRHLKPRRIIEVGSGFSSLLMADVNRRFLGNATDITCIEPYPQPFLRQKHQGISRLIEAKVQDVSLDEFARLEAGDVLFIDSSHVSKIGSDVNYLLFEVLPTLKPGVIVHVHDIPLPHDYPKHWVLDEGRNWNESYVVRALLMYSKAFRILFGSYYAYYRFPELVASGLGLGPGAGYGGLSLWLEVLEHD
jgi:predicted O-methyltransferase YrrM